MMPRPLSPTARPLSAADGGFRLLFILDFREELCFSILISIGLLRGLIFLDYLSAD
jgi:hypothetical protein